MQRGGDDDDVQVAMGALSLSRSLLFGTVIRSATARSASPVSCVTHKTTLFGELPHSAPTYTSPPVPHRSPPPLFVS